MKNLPFLTTLYGTEKEKHSKKLENLKKERKMVGKEIVQILKDKLDSNGFLTITERNYNAWNTNPFDLVAGDEKTCGVIGFEIKGDTDDFSLLKKQLRYYEVACDKVFLVLHKKSKPEWLPMFIGIIRVFEDKEIYIEESGYLPDYLDVSTGFQWDALFKSNELGNTSKRTEEILRIVLEVRKNILFNRFFADEPDSSGKLKNFYPFTDEQKSILIGFDVHYHYKKLQKDTRKLEKRLDTLKGILSLGQKSIKDFEKLGTTK